MMATMTAAEPKLRGVTETDSSLSFVGDVLVSVGHRQGLVTQRILEATTKLRTLADDLHGCVESDAPVNSDPQPSSGGRTEAIALSTALLEDVLSTLETEIARLGV